MDLQGKVWGQTSSLFNRNNVEVHYLVCKKDGFCSIHSHTHKYNKFIVLSGSLKIKIWKNYNLIDETILTTGHECVVRPGEKHQFVVLEGNTTVLEIYWTEIDPDDIVRDSVGGVGKLVKGGKRI